MRSAPQPHQPLGSAETSAIPSAHATDSVPLLLVPGWADEATRIEPFRQAFLAEGWSPTRVAVVDFEDPFGSNLEHAREIARAVEGLVSLTDAERVDVVAHSMGGLALRQYLHFEGGAERIRRVVFLGTPHRGSVAAMLAWGAGGREMVPGSEFLNRLNGESPAVPEQVEALSIRTATDLRVIPATSAVLSGAPNLEVCCPSHEELIEGGTRVFDHVLAFLRDGPDGVPDADVPTDWVEWSEERFQPGMGSWSLWGGGWAEETLRRWLLPSWNAPRDEGG